jgi:CHAD domain-containing protein
MPLRDFFATAIRGRTRRLNAHVTAHDLPSDELIHEIRVATKEFRAYVRLLANTAGAAFCEREDQRLRSAAQLLAPDRDPLVVRQTLEKLARDCDQITGRHSLHRILLHLGEQRGFGPKPAPIRQAVAALNAAAQSIARRFDGRLQDDQLLAAFRREYRQARRMTRRKRGKPDKDAWHRWRKRIKSLHYQVNCLEGKLPRKLTRLTHDTWQLQGLLGRHHDLHVTRQRVRRLRVDPINEPCRRRSLRVIDRQIDRLEKRIFKWTRGVLKASPVDFVARVEKATCS